MQNMGKMLKSSLVGPYVLRTQFKCPLKAFIFYTCKDRMLTSSQVLDTRWVSQYSLQGTGHKK